MLNANWSLKTEELIFNTLNESTAEAEKLLKSRQAYLSSNTMKTKHLLIAFLITTIGMVVSSCNQKDETPTGTGIIKVSIAYSPPSSSSYVYYLSEQFTVRLKKNGSTIATQYSPQGGTLDMGVYDYGTYEVQVTGKEGRTNITTGQNTTNYDSFNSSQTVVLDASTKTASFSF